MLRSLSFDRLQTCVLVSFSECILRWSYLMTYFIICYVFQDLQRSMGDACLHYHSREESSDEKEFWVQCPEASGSPLLGHRMRQLARLQWSSRSALEGVRALLWLYTPLLSSFFRLVQHLWSATNRNEIWKRFACVEGTREMYAAAQTWWLRLDGADVARPSGGDYMRNFGLLWAGHASSSDILGKM